MVNLTLGSPIHHPSFPSVSQNFTRFDLGNSRHRCSLPNWSVGAAGQELNTVQSLGNDGCLQSSQTTELFLKNSRVRAAKKTTQKPAEEGDHVSLSPLFLFILTVPHKVTRLWVALSLVAIFRARLSQEIMPVANKQNLVKLRSFCTVKDYN